MSQKLENFMKEHRLPLEFRETTNVTYNFDGRKSTRREKAQWTCHMPSMFLGQTASIETRRSCVYQFYTNGKTRKEVREKLVKFIRGKTLAYGWDRKRKVKVPKDIR